MNFQVAFARHGNIKLYLYLVLSIDEVVAIRVQQEKILLFLALGQYVVFHVGLRGFLLVKFLLITTMMKMIPIFAKVIVERYKTHEVEKYFNSFYKIQLYDINYIIHCYEIC